MINVAIAEDQAGLREAFVRLINGFHRMNVCLVVVDGMAFNVHRSAATPEHIGSK